MNRELLTLIAITDDLHDGVDGLVSRAVEAVRGGATMVEVRLKHADSNVLVEVTRALVAALTVPVIVNDRADVALAAGAAGVHLGPDDLPVRAVRSIVPAGFLIGASILGDQDVDNAGDADYVAIGSVFGTRSKRDAGPPIGLEEFVRLAKLTTRPAVGVGGITPERAAAVMEAGATGVASVSAVFGAERPYHAALAIRSATGK